MDASLPGGPADRAAGKQVTHTAITGDSGPGQTIPSRASVAAVVWRLYLVSSDDRQTAVTEAGASHCHTQLQ